MATAQSASYAEMAFDANAFNPLHYTGNTLGSNESNITNFHSAWDTLGFMQGLRTEEQQPKDRTGSSDSSFQAPFQSSSNQQTVQFHPHDSGINFSDCSVSSPGSSSSGSKSEAEQNTSRDESTFYSPEKLAGPSTSQMTEQPKTDFPPSPILSKYPQVHSISEKLIITSSF